MIVRASSVSEQLVSSNGNEVAPRGQGSYVPERQRSFPLEANRNTYPSASGSGPSKPYLSKTLFSAVRSTSSKPVSKCSMTGSFVNGLTNRDGLCSPRLQVCSRNEYSVKPVSPVEGRKTREVIQCFRTLNFNSPSPPQSAQQRLHAEESKSGTLPARRLWFR